MRSVATMWLALKHERGRDSMPPAVNRSLGRPVLPSLTSRTRRPMLAPTHSGENMHKLAVLTVVLGWTVVAAAAPSTLVVKGADGKMGPGAAKSWTAGKDSVSF